MKPSSVEHFESSSSSTISFLSPPGSVSTRCSTRPPLLLAAFSNLAADATALNRAADDWNQQILTGDMDTEERAAQAALFQVSRSMASLAALYDELRRSRAG